MKSTFVDVSQCSLHARPNNSSDTHIRTEQKRRNQTVKAHMDASQPQYIMC